MAMKGRLAAGVAVVSTGAFALLIDMPVIGAAESSVDEEIVVHRFMRNGQEVACEVGGNSTLTQESAGDPFVASARTFIDDDASTVPTDPCYAFVRVGTTYTDTSGAPKSHEAGAYVFVRMDNRDVGDNYVAEHTVEFQNCTSDCIVTFTTSPK